MTESELLQQAAANMTADVTSVVALFSFVFGYLAALYLFIRMTSLFVRTLSFIVFTLAYVYITFAQLTAKRLWRGYEEAVSHAWSEGILPPHMEPTAATSGMIEIAELNGYALIALGYFVVLYVNFFYRWRTLDQMPTPDK